MSKRVVVSGRLVDTPEPVQLPDWGTVCFLRLRRDTGERPRPGESRAPASRPAERDRPRQARAAGGAVSLRGSPRGDLWARGVDPLGGGRGQGAGGVVRDRRTRRARWARRAPARLEASPYNPSCRLRRAATSRASRMTADSPGSPPACFATRERARASRSHTSIGVRSCNEGGGPRPALCNRSRSVPSRRLSTSRRSRRESSSCAVAAGPPLATSLSSRRSHSSRSMFNRVSR